MKSKSKYEMNLDCWSSKQLASALGLDERDLNRTHYKVFAKEYRDNRIFAYHLEFLGVINSTNFSVITSLDGSNFAYLKVSELELDYDNNNLSTNSTDNYLDS